RQTTPAPSRPLSAIRAPTVLRYEPSGEHSHQKTLKDDDLPTNNHLNLLGLNDFPGRRIETIMRRFAACAKRPGFDNSGGATMSPTRLS
ncbi:MAG TPA: hypothetical protein QF469_07320, partial [Sphingomonas sanguinis]|uniref:hypothetical protein n=1 Tax=Sphingomonas sanguinis TaxID=33051 RepID=UPI002AC1726F|nr:hypothetical protein [Sphingomonas sanguinis]